MMFSSCSPNSVTSVSSVAGCLAAAAGGDGALWFAKQIGLSFVWGLAMSLTPCVYPMVFITAAIVAGRGRKGRLAALFAAITYVLGLSLVYGLLGMLVAMLGGEVRFFLDTAWVRVPMAVIFAVLALSMFDVFSIGFGEGLVARARTALAGKGGLVGIFALGAVSALAASPCLTGPLALLLYRVAETGDRLVGFWSLFAMAWGMGVVLIIAGTATGLLPKAGAWTIWVKQLLGFVLFWAAAYFLEPVVGAAAYRVATGVIILSGAVFLGGIDRLTPESGARARLRVAAGLVAIILGASLMLGGLGIVRPGSSAAVPGRERSESVWTDAAAEDVERALASRRPVVIDFYGDACPICVKLERETLSDGRVLAELEGFEALRINASREKGLRRRFSLMGAPTVILFDGEGNEVERFSGFRKPSEFLAFLAKARAKGGGTGRSPGEVDFPLGGPATPAEGGAPAKACPT